MKNAKNTLYISDLDGTLLNNNAEISKETETLLNTLIDSGVHFSVATARTLATAEILLRNLRLQVPIVLMNGVLVYDMGEQRYAQIHYLSPNIIPELLKILRRHKTTAILYKLLHDEQHSYHEPSVSPALRDFIDERKNKYYKSFQQVDTLENIDPNKIIYFTLLDTYEKIKPVAEELDSFCQKTGGCKTALYEDSYHPGTWYLEVFSDRASKENGVRYLRDTHDFTHIVGFGDNFNDLPMFRACDTAVAVANAKPELKSVAHFIADSNENHGVAQWIAAHSANLSF